MQHLPPAVDGGVPVAAEEGEDDCGYGCGGWLVHRRKIVRC